MRASLVLALILLAAGVWLLGSGITGRVVSQSCCFPPDCPREYWCDAAEPHVELPMAAARTATGGALVLAALLVVWRSTRDNV